MEIKIKLLSDKAKLPVKGTDDSAGYDLTVASAFWDSKNNIISYGFGIALEIPKGWVGLIFPRSSIYKKNLDLTNCVGVIDSDYRGEINAKFRLLNSRLDNVYTIGERAAQIVFVQHGNVDFKVSNELSETLRGVGGYGHTGD